MLWEYKLIVSQTMKYLLLLAAMSLLACPSPRQSPIPFTVEYRGALRNFMHQGDLSAKASLSDLRDLPHLYALGAAENLKGEIQVFDGKPANSFVSDSRLVIDTAFGKNAALLVWTSVEQWTSVPVPDGVSAYEELETFIEKAARESGIDTKKPFPFLLEGAPAALDWHVIDWPEGDTEHTHEKHRTSDPTGRCTTRRSRSSASIRIPTTPSSPTTARICTCISKPAMAGPPDM
jgi:acetolactate decarboxylase